MSFVGSIRIEVSPGELFDKISILEIKSERIAEEQKLQNVRNELDTLTQSRNAAITANPKLAGIVTRLKTVNERLWNIEDRIRGCEREGNFGPEFIELARSVYRQNDMRAALKRQINDLLGARLIEEKAYVDYTGEHRAL